MKRFDLTDLAVPVIAAPMAGGPSTPELAASVTNHGGLGFIAGGLLSADALAGQLLATRALTSGPLAVNLFVPQPRIDANAQWTGYAAALADEAQRHGVQLGEPRYEDFQWQAKLDVLQDIRPEVVSFTFGLPSVVECNRLKESGSTVLAMVTSMPEARQAVGIGIDALVVQGPRAGGHCGSFEAAAVLTDESLDELVTELVRDTDVPIVAAGGLATASDVRRVIAAGAAAAQCGTAFLLAQEAGTAPVHRAALSSPEFSATVLTRAFTGRYARALRNRFIDAHEAEAVFGFPQVALMTAPLIAAAAQAGDPHGFSLWAGTEFRSAKTAFAAEITAELAQLVPQRS